MTAVCEQCGKQFEAIRATARFCSAACRVANNRMNKIQMPRRQIESIDQKDYDRQHHLDKFKEMGLDSVDWITTGIPDFDALTQIPRGRVTQIQGPYAVGKTTLALNMLAGLARTTAKVLYIDSEASLSPERMVELGLNSDNFTLYNESAFIEDIYDVILEAVQSPQYDLIILDSLAACTFRVEAANEAADANIGQKAKVIGKLMRIVPMELRRTGAALVIINQEREVVGSFFPQKYTPGGMGVPYAASLMISLKSTKGMRFPKGAGPYKGQEVTAEIIKSKVSEPWRKTTFKLFYGGGDTDEAATPKDRGSKRGRTAKVARKKTGRTSRQAQKAGTDVQGAQLAPGEDAKF